MKTPILFLIFNRPEETAKVLAAIKAYKPEKIFIAADGPRQNKIGEDNNCRLARELVERGIDWPCEKKFLFRSKNLGCRTAVSSAIDWFFREVEEGIILEDDCLPHPDFFIFCEKLLFKYRFDDRVMHIGGNNFLFNQINISTDYYFSHIPHIWGWASWRRAWQKYDVSLKDWPEFKAAQKLKKIFPSKIISAGWTRIFDAVYSHKIDTWDFQWTYAILKNNGYCLNPAVNLVSNIGFSEAATHTKGKNKFAALPVGPLANFRGPEELEYNNQADNYILKNNFGFSYSRRLIDFSWGIWGGLKRILKKYEDFAFKHVR